MYKITAILICALLLAGCGSNEPAETVTETTTAPTTAAAVTETEVTEEDVENPLQPLADAAMSAGEWPSLWEVTDPDMISDFFLLNAGNENYRNMIVLQCPMSANMTELIIIEADKPYDAAADLEARRKKASEQDAFYPNDVEKAEAAIIGTKGDYAYFILCADPAAAEKALLEAIE